MKKGLLKYIFPLACLAWLALAPGAWAQQRQVTGKVTDSETGDGFPGVSVLEVGTSNGTVTDLNGNYSLTVGNNARISFSFIGYTTQEVEVGSRSVIDVPLVLDVKQLQELVVTGYTIDNRRETAGAISTVKPKDLVVVPTGNVEQTLQGRLSGVTVITNGQPGTTSQVRVRGFGSFENNAPLYIVDGLPVPSTDFLSPDDIESVTVLKDAAAASIYGARASSGVVVYTTKKGKRDAGKVSVSYNAQYGFTTPGQGQEMLNPQEFAEWTWNAERNAAMQEGREPNFDHPQFGTGSSPVIPEYLSVGPLSGAQVTGTVNLAEEAENYNVDPTAGPVYQVTRANTAGTDWYDEITQTAPMMRHNLGFSGGSDNSRYYLSLNLQEQKGALIHSNFKRYAFRANSEFDLLPNLRFGENIQLTYLERLGITGDNGGIGSADDENVVLSAFRMPSIIPVYDEFGGYAGTASRGFNNPRNPVAERDGARNNRNFGGVGIGNMYLEYDPIPGLTLRSNIGGQYSQGYNWSYSRRQYENSENNSAFQYNEGAGYNFAWTFNNTAQYKKTFGIHNIDLLVGQEALNDGKGKFVGASGQNPFSQDPNFITITTTGNILPASSGYYLGNNFYSVFGRAKYILDDKYILEAVVRRDGSSKFGSNTRYGVFPAFSGAWRISSEDFMSSLTFIDELKIRGGYGTMGNSNAVDANNQFSLYGTSVAASSYDITGSNSSARGGFYRTRIGNPNAQWETAVTMNVGVDGTFLDGKLDVILDFWQKDTKDLLFRLPVPAVLGQNATAPFVNVGQIVNKGIDLQVITRGNITSDLTYELNVTGSILKNEISSLSEGLDYITYINPGFRGIFPVRNQVGYSMSSFFGYEVAGLWQSQAEVDEASEQVRAEALAEDPDLTDEDLEAILFQAGAAPGRFRYVDLNGDNRITDADRKILGSPVPKFTGGLTFTLGYKNFDLYTQLYTSLGNKVYNVSKLFTDFYPTFSGAAISARVRDSWTPENTDAELPIFEKASNFSTNSGTNSYYMEDGSYLRMQNLSLGYTMPAAMLSRLGMTQLRIAVSANNLFTVTKYSGLDPAVGGAVDTQFGIDLGNVPMTRSYTLGLNLGF